MEGWLLTSALLMGISGGPHCLMMCGASCSLIGQAVGEKSTQAMVAFHLGRLFGYSAMGAVAAASVQTLGWLGIHSAALRPLWIMLHVAAVLLGLLLLWRGQQPLWLAGAGRYVWRRAQKFTRDSGIGAAGLLGVMWALLPCGLLYSALMLAGLSAHPLAGAGAMACFALGSNLVLLLGPWLWLKLQRGQLVGLRHTDWGVRLSGLALAALSAWVLWVGVAHDQAPWCTPSAAVQNA